MCNIHAYFPLKCVSLTYQVLKAFLGLSKSSLWTFLSPPSWNDSTCGHSCSFFCLLGFCLSTFGCNHNFNLLVVVFSLSLSFLLWSFRTKKREKKKEVFQPFGPLSRVSEQLKDFLQKKTHFVHTISKRLVHTYSLSLCVPDLFNFKKFSLEQSASNYCTLCDCCGCRNSCFCINQTKLQY